MEHKDLLEKYGLKKKYYYTVCELGDGLFYPVRKESIKTDFFYGYGINGVSTEEDYQDARSSAKAVETNEEIFIKSNMHFYDQIEREIREADKIIKMPYGERGLCDFASNYYLNYYRCDWIALVVRDITEEDRNNLLQAVRKAKKLHVKRLKSYLKRYGLSKITTSVHLID